MSGNRRAVHKILFNRRGLDVSTGHWSLEYRCAIPLTHQMSEHQMISLLRGNMADSCHTCCEYSIPNLVLARVVGIGFKMR